MYIERNSHRISFAYINRGIVHEGGFSFLSNLLGLIKRTCRGLDDPEPLKTLFCSLVRSHLEYCSVVWSPYTKRNIKKIEGVQRRATRFILKTEDDYDTRLRKLNLMLADVTFLFKALNGITSINVNSYEDFYFADKKLYISLSILMVYL